MNSSGEWSARRGQPIQSRAARFDSSIHYGFTVTELLIVIGIIVLVLAMGMPAFNALTGSKSNDMALNTISSMLAQARNEAIGFGEYRGVMLYLDPDTQAIKLAIVSQAEPPASPLPVDVYLDLSVDETTAGPVARETLSLPKGVGIQFVDDAGAAANDRYIGFNNANADGGLNPLLVRYGGVILFDGHGQLASRSYAFKAQRPNPTGGATPWYTAMGALLYTHTDPAVAMDYPIAATTHTDVVPADPTTALIFRSQLGFVLFDSEQFDNQGFTPQDVQVSGAGGEPAEEAWLDTNALPVLINRYNGTLVPGE